MRDKQSMMSIEWFQSPCGVLGVCRQLRGAANVLRAEVVSVPLRGFRGLQEAEAFAEDKKLMVFQSPCGVLGVCRWTIANALGTARECFSPLAGF